jgi:phage baseplate assembly protein W
MGDLSHQWGADLEIGPTGDLATAGASMETRQRILRRLLTTQGEYIWQRDYGAGLARFVGSPADTGQIAAIVRSQLLRENNVSRTHEATISIRGPRAGGGEQFYLDVQYQDAASNTAQVLTTVVAPGA